MLYESRPHHYRLKTLSINSPELHIYESWEIENKQGKINYRILTGNCTLQKRWDIHEKYENDSPSFKTNIIMSYFKKYS